MIGYLVSSYPTVSHTFIMREVLALRALGRDVATITIRRPNPGQLLSTEDREESRSTFAILPIRLAVVAKLSAHTFFRNPLQYVKTIALALRWSRPGWRGTLWSVFYFAEATVLLDHCRRHGIKQLHAHFFNVAVDVAALTVKLGSKAGGPTSWSFTLHGTDELHGTLPAGVAQRVEAASFVACVSHFARTQLQLMTPPEEWSKFKIIRTGLDLQRYRPTSSASREKLAVRILTVGRLVSLKGHAMLIEGIARVRPEADVSLTVVGDGPERVNLEALVKRLNLEGVVEFAGSVGQDEINDFYDHADVFCMTSLSEGVPAVLMEAMAMRVPVVAPRLMGIPELVEDGVSGRLFTPGDVEGLIAALQTVLVDIEEGSRFGEAGRHKVEDAFTIGQSARDLDRAFRAVLCGV